MGIDIYLTDHKCDHDSETDNAFRQQLAYIRESYHGEPYPSKIFLSESFAEYDVRVTVDLLEDRLAETIKLAIERHFKVYNGRDDIREAIEPYIKFYEAVKELEANGKEAWVTNSY